MPIPAQSLAHLQTVEVHWDTSLIRSHMSKLQQKLLCLSEQTSQTFHQSADNQPVLELNDFIPQCRFYRHSIWVEACRNPNSPGTSGWSCFFLFPFQRVMPADYSGLCSPHRQESPRPHISSTQQYNSSKTSVVDLLLFLQRTKQWKRCWEFQIFDHQINFVSVNN